METKDLLKKVRKIEIKTKRLSDHIFGGEYQSTFKGRGMAFSEVRQYQFGDDVRAIDWNVTARYNDTFIKVFEEERELTMMLIIDISGSNFFGSNSVFKNEYVTELAATLAFSATKNNDKVGLILFSDIVELYIPPKKGKSHVLRIIRELLDFKPISKKTDIHFAFKFLSNVQKNKSIVFIISDFISPDYFKSLKIIRTQQNLFTKLRKTFPKWNSNAIRNTIVFILIVVLVVTLLCLHWVNSRMRTVSTNMESAMRDPPPNRRALDPQLSQQFQPYTSPPRRNYEHRQQWIQCQVIA